VLPDTHGLHVFRRLRALKALLPVVRADGARRYEREGARARGGRRRVRDDAVLRRGAGGGDPCACARGRSSRPRTSAP
jgi:hypothetical protein